MKIKYILWCLLLSSRSIATVNFVYRQAQNQYAWDASPTIRRAYSSPCLSRATYVGTTVFPPGYKPSYQQPVYYSPPRRELPQSRRKAVAQVQTDPEYFDTSREYIKKALSSTTSNIQSASILTDSSSDYHMVDLSDGKPNKQTGPLHFFIGSASASGASSSADYSYEGWGNFISDVAPHKSGQVDIAVASIPRSETAALWWHDFIERG